MSGDRAGHQRREPGSWPTGHMNPKPTPGGRVPGFRQVYDEHFPFVWRSLRRLGVAPCDLSDAAQEVFLVVHRRLGEFEGRAKLTTWLFRIALNVARDMGSRAHRRREAADSEAIARLGDGAEEAGMLLDRRRAADRLLGALGALDLDQRAAVVLFELEGFSGSEIAEMLEVAVPTVHSRLRLGRAALRRELGRLEARDRGEASRRRSSP